MINPKEIPIVEYSDTSFYDFVLEELDSDKNILKENEGKVTMVVNITGECANSAQYVTIQNLYDEYRDKGFEVIAVPSTDFCADGYGEFAGTSANAETMRDHMKNLYKTDLPFSKMTSINPTYHSPDSKEEPHPMYEKIQEKGGPIQGNFEKIIIGRDGKKMIRFCNSDLLNLAFNAGERTIDSDTALSLIKESIETFLKD